MIYDPPPCWPCCQISAMSLFGILLWSVSLWSTLPLFLLLLLPPPAHPRASSLSSQQTSPAPPLCAVLQLFNLTQKNIRGNKTPFVHRFMMCKIRSEPCTCVVVRISSRLVCQVLVTISAPAQCVYVFGWGRISQQESDIISENEPLCLFCCVNNESLCNFCFSPAFSFLFFLVLFVGCLGFVPTALEAGCITTITTTLHL